MTTRHIVISEKDFERLELCIELYKKKHPDRKHSIISKREIIGLILDDTLE